MASVNVPELRTAASAYARERLQGEELLREPPAKALKAIVVVPICKEPVRRVLELFDSIGKQEGMEHGAVEVLGVVNNGRDDGSAAYHLKKNANQLLMELPVWNNPQGVADHKYPETMLRTAREIGSKLPFFVIDKSSSGNELAEPCAGAARDRGLAEAVARYLQLERNGLVIFLDADVILDDTTYLKKAIEAFERDSALRCATGLLEYRFDPDASQVRERSREIEQLKHYLGYRKWQLMREYLQKGTVELLPFDSCIGSQVLVRAYDAAAWGGWPHTEKNEDTLFGERGRCRKLRELKASTAMRYQHWMGREFDPTVDEIHLPYSEADLADLERKLAASEQGKAFLERLQDVSVLLYRSVSVR